MDNRHDEPPSVVYGDIENLHRELEQLAASLKPMPADRDQIDSPQAATILFRGK